MEAKELISLFKKISKDYFNVELGYDNKEQLQHWRQQLVFIYASLANRTSIVSANKIYQERRKDTVRSEEYKRISEESAGSKGKTKSATAINAEIGDTEAYKKWSDDYSKAYGQWQQFTDLQESVKLTIDSISSHLRNIATSDYLDPK